MNTDINNSSNLNNDNNLNISSNPSLSDYKNIQHIYTQDNQYQYDNFITKVNVGRINITAHKLLLTYTNCSLSSKKIYETLNSNTSSKNNTIITFAGYKDGSNINCAVRFDKRKDLRRGVGAVIVDSIEPTIRTCTDIQFNAKTDFIKSMLTDDKFLYFKGDENIKIEPNKNKDLFENVISRSTSELVSLGYIPIQAAREIMKTKEMLGYSDPVEDYNFFIRKKAIWVFGKIGTGKTHWAKTTYKNSLFIKTKDNLWDNYNFERHILIDNLHLKEMSDMSMSLLEWAEENTLIGSTRNGFHHTINIDTLIVTSPYLPFVAKNLEDAVVKQLINKFDFVEVSKGLWRTVKPEELHQLFHQFIMTKKYPINIEDTSDNWKQLRRDHFNINKPQSNPQNMLPSDINDPFNVLVDDIKKEEIIDVSNTTEKKEKKKEKEKKGKEKVVIKSLAEYMDHCDEDYQYEKKKGRKKEEEDDEDDVDDEDDLSSKAQDLGPDNSPDDNTDPDEYDENDGFCVRDNEKIQKVKKDPVLDNVKKVSKKRERDLPMKKGKGRPPKEKSLGIKGLINTPELNLFKGKGKSKSEDKKKKKK
jgi:hypothetical protein